MTVIQEGKLRFFFPEEWQVKSSDTQNQSRQTSPPIFDDFDRKTTEIYRSTEQYL